MIMTIIHFIIIANITLTTTKYYYDYRYFVSPNSENK